MPSFVHDRNQDLSQSLSPMSSQFDLNSNENANEMMHLGGNCRRKNNCVFKILGVEFFAIWYFQWKFSMFLSVTF